MGSGKAWLHLISIKIAILKLILDLISISDRIKQWESRDDNRRDIDSLSVYVIKLHVMNIRDHHPIFLSLIYY